MFAAAVTPPVVDGRGLAPEIGVGGRSLALSPAPGDLLLQNGVAVDIVAGLANVVGLGVLAAAVAAVVAAIYRWIVADTVPRGVTTLLGLCAVALVLNTTAAFGQVLTGVEDPLALAAVGFNGAAFVVATVLAPIGRRVGDRVAVTVAAVTGAVEVDAEVGRLVKTVGRVVVVTLPDHAREIDDVVGYEPVSAETKAELTGKTFLFPRRLRVGDLQERLATRLRDDYDVGVVDVTLDASGAVTYLAIGRQPVGLGQSLPPETAAVAVRADPANAASAGDLVQLWERPTDAASVQPNGERDVRGDAEGETPDERDVSSADTRLADSSDSAGSPSPREDGGTASTPTRVATGEVRAVVGDVVTLAVDASVAPRVAGGRYRLVTLPYDPPADREFVALSTGADETLTTLVVGDGRERGGRDEADAAARAGDVVASTDAAGAADAERVVDGSADEPVREATWDAVTPSDCPARVLAVWHEDGSQRLPPLADVSLAPGDCVAVWGTPAAIRETATLLDAESGGLGGGERARDGRTE